jgi:hypothetical protein
MTGAEWFVGAVVLMYSGAAVHYGLQGQWGWSLIYSAYTLANIGLIIVAVQGRMS